MSINTPDKFLYKTTITNTLRNDIISKLKKFKLPRYLEIGSDIGLTYFSLNSFYHECFAVDIDDNRHGKSIEIQRDFEKRGIKFNPINRIYGDVLSVENNNYDVVLIDGDHSYAGAKLDFETILSKNESENFFVFFHDYGLVNAGVKKFVDEIIESNLFSFEYAGEEKDWNPLGSSPTNDWESVCFHIEKK